MRMRKTPVHPANIITTVHSPTLHAPLNAWSLQSACSSRTVCRSYQQQSCRSPHHARHPPPPRSSRDLWKEVVVTHFTIVFQPFSGETEVNYDIVQYIAAISMNTNSYKPMPNIETEYPAGDVPASPAVWSAAYIPDGTAAIQCAILLQDRM